MKLKKYIKTGVKWSLPDTNKIIIDVYLLEVPKGITKSFYLWVSTGMRNSYKNQSFINRILNKKEFIFKNKNV